MPFMRFEATDPTGKFVSGTLQAASAQELQAILARQNLTLRSLEGKPLAPNTAPKPVARQVERPVAQARPAPVAQPTAASAVFSPVLTSKQSQLLYTQWASFLRSGFSSAQMISHSTARYSGRAKASFEAMEKEVAGGMALSEAMARRPKTFTLDAVATIKAAEASGTLPDALDLLATAVEKSRAFRVPLWYFFFMSAALIWCGVGGIAVQTASHKTISRQFDADGKLPQVGTLVQELVKAQGMFWVGLFLALFFLGVVWLLYRPAMAMFRHTVGYNNPIARGRAMSEAVMRVGWTMNAMLQAGVAPYRAIQTALESIPNLALRKRALDRLSKHTESDPLHIVMARTGLFEPQYVDILQNGELTGNPTAAMSSVMSAEASNFEFATNKTRVYVAGITTIVMGIFTALMVLMLYLMYFKNMMSMFDRV